MEASVTSANQNSQEVQTIVQLVVFNLGSEEYAIPIHDVKEVVKTPEITSVPNSPDFILGIINLRGNIIPVLDLRRVFAMNIEDEALEREHVIVTQTETPYGILVNKVSEVISVNELDIQPSPGVTANKIAQDYIQGVVIVSEEDEEDKKTKAKQEVVVKEEDKAEDDTKQKALLILRVSKIVAAKDLVIDPSIVKTPIAETTQNDVQIIEEASIKEVNNE